MSQQRIRIKRRATSTVPDDILTNDNLSWPARVLLGWMLGRSPEFELHVWYLRKIFRLSEKQWVRIRRNLEEQGYFLQQQEKDKGTGHFTWTNTVSDQAEFSPSPHKRGDGPPPLDPPDGLLLDGQPLDGNRGDIPRVSNTSLSNTTTNHVVVGEIEELIEAAVWAAPLIKHEAGFRRKVRSRILEEGPNPEDLHALAVWRANKSKIEKEQNQQEQERQAAIEHNARRAEQSARSETYFNSLDEVSRTKLVEQFSAHLAANNSGILQFYRKSGLGSKVVQAELFKFIAKEIEEAIA